MKKRIFFLIVISIFTIASCGSDGKNGEKTDYDVIVIGAGGGGLAAAAKLAMEKKRVLIIEQHSKVGGYMGSFKRGDYTFEISLHSMDGLEPGNGRNIKVFKDAGIYDKLKPIKMDPMYKVIYPGLTMTVPADCQEYKKILLKRFPHEKEGIENFYAALLRIEKAMNAGMLMSDGEFLAGLWKIIKNPRAMGTLMYYGNATMGDLIKDFFTDKLLISAITALTGSLGDGPDSISGLIFAATWNSYHRGGYYYFEGGSQAIATAFEEVITENGGEIMLNTLVTKIIVKDGAAAGVQTEHGKSYSSRYVVSNANAPDTFNKLVGREHLDEDFLKEMSELEVGPAIFNLYIGVNKDYTDMFAGTSHQIIVNQFDDYNEIFKPMQVGDIENVQFGIANYSNLEPDIAPKGKNVLSIVTLMPYDWHNGWDESKGKPAYNKLKREVAHKLIKRIEKILPGLSSHIEVLEVATPRTDEHYTLNYKGSIYGWANTVEQSMMNRMPQTTPIDNLLLASAWTFPAGGQSAVILSGLTAARMILEDME